jgi:hypothetical protein
MVIDIIQRRWCKDWIMQMQDVMDVSRIIRRR